MDVVELLLLTCVDGERLDKAATIAGGFLGALVVILLIMLLTAAGIVIVVKKGSTQKYLLD